MHFNLRNGIYFSECINQRINYRHVHFSCGYAVMFSSSTVLFTLYFSNILLLIFLTVLWLIFKYHAISLVLSPCLISAISSPSLLVSKFRSAEGRYSAILTREKSCRNSSSLTPLKLLSVVTSLIKA